MFPGGAHHLAFQMKKKERKVDRTCLMKELTSSLHHKKKGEKKSGDGRCELQVYSRLQYPLACPEEANYGSSARLEIRYTVEAISHTPLIGSEYCGGGRIEEKASGKMKGLRRLGTPKALSPGLSNCALEKKFFCLKSRGETPCEAP